VFRAEENHPSSHGKSVAEPKAGLSQDRGGEECPAFRVLAREFNLLLDAALAMSEFGFLYDRRCLHGDPCC